MSRQASSRGSSGSSAGRGAAAAAQRQRGVYVQAPKSDIYVALLGISLGAILIATILMVVLFSQYEFKTKAVSTTTVAATRIA